MAPMSTLGCLGAGALITRRPKMCLSALVGLGRTRGVGLPGFGKKAAASNSDPDRGALATFCSIIWVLAL